MDATLEPPSEEVARLRGCLNDLVSVLTLPAGWAGSDSTQIVSAVLDALRGMLRLAFVFARLDDPEGGAPLEILRAAGISDVDLTMASARLGLKGELGIVVAGSERQDFPTQTEKLLLDVSNWLVGRDDLLARDYKTWSFPRVQLTDDQAKLWHWAMFLGLPLFFAYSGSATPGEPYTYRVQGPEFVVEFLNVQADSAKNPANHIHSAWRRLPIDFGLTE